MRDRYDWLELAIRVTGVWLVALGALGVLGGIAMQVSDAYVALPTDIGQGAKLVGASIFLAALGTSFLGTVMVLLAPGAVAWLKRKDAAARAPHGGQVRPSEAH